MSNSRELNVEELAAGGNSSMMYDNIPGLEFVQSAYVDEISVGTLTMNTGNVFGSTIGLSSKVSFVLRLLCNETNTDPNTSSLISLGPISYAKLVIGEPTNSEWFTNTAYGFILGKRVAYLVVANYVRNTGGKYGLVKSVLNSSTGLFFFQFSSMNGLDSMLENGLWFICNNPLILKKWNLDVNLLKEDFGNVLVWVKLYCFPMTAFSNDGLSVISTKLGTPLMLDSSTSDMCTQLWGRSSYARAMIELRADVELKDTIVVAMHKLVRDGFYTCSDVAKNLKNPTQAPRGVSVGPKMGFKPIKQLCRPVSKKNNANTSGNKKKDAESRKEVSNPNPFDILNLVKNDVDLGTNGGTSNLASKEANSSGSSFWNVESSSPSTTPIVEKINKLEKLIIDGKITLVDDEGKPLEKVDYSGDHDNEDEVEPVDHGMTSFLASEMVGCCTNSLLEQLRETYENADYDYDPYDDDLYKGQEIPDNIQSICDKLDIKNPNPLNEPNEAIPEENPVIPDPNQVVDVHDTNEMIDISDDVDLVDYDGDDEENPEEDPEEEPEPNNGLVNRFGLHVYQHQPGVMIGWLEENDSVNEGVNNEDIKDEDV
ncbi:reverse transcriptase domain-containing protein, partial [Tanacetum coccineum]